MSSAFKTESNFEFKKKNKRVAVLDERGIMLSNTDYFLEEFFQKKPALQAVNELTGTNTTLGYTIANKDFCVAGTNMTTALATFSTKGGVTITTAGASADQAIILPSLTTGLTAWTGISWLTQSAPRYEVWLRTGANITGTTIWAGMKLTSGGAITTDNDAVFFRYNDTEQGGNLQLITSRSNVDTVTVIPIKIAVSTLYRLVISINSTLQVGVAINGKRWNLNVGGGDGVTGASGTAPLTTAISLIPYVGVQAGAVAAKAIDVLYMSMRLAA